MFSFILSETGLIWWFRNFSYDFHFLAFFDIKLPKQINESLWITFREHQYFGAPTGQSDSRVRLLLQEKDTLFLHLKGLGKTMREITLSSLAATKMMLHCYKYPHLRKLENIHFSNLSTRPVFWASKYSVDNFFMNFDWKNRFTRYFLG